MGKLLQIRGKMYGKTLALLAFAFFVVNITDVNAQLVRDDAFHAQYHLDKVVMVGRHHVRSGVISKGERRITPHQWHQWSVGDGNLTERGALLERQMGTFYHQWTMSEHLFGESSSPVVKQTRLYANSMSRTVTTAQNFALGFSPDSTMNVEYDTSVKFGSMSPVFNDVSTKLNDRIMAKANAEADGCFAPDDFVTVIGKMEEDARVMARVLDLENAPSCVQNDTCSFHFQPPELYLHLKWMPRIIGGNIYLAQMASGNLILQYYDMPESRGSIFGHPVTIDDLKAIGRIKDWWCFLSMGHPTVGRDVAHRLLIRLKEEMEDPGMRLSYLVGHDSNMAALVGALDMENYILADTPEEKTPLGGKITFEIWKDEEDKSYVALNYVYQNLDQIMGIVPLTLETPPMVCPLRLKGIKTNPEGLYPMEDFMAFLDKAIAEYDVLEEYKKGDVNLDRHIDMLDVVDIMLHLKGSTWKFFREEVADDNGDGGIDEADAVNIMERISRSPLSE